MKIQSLQARLKELEDGMGFVALSDGTKFRPQNSGISLLREAVRLEESLGHPPLLQDFSEQQQSELQSYAKWDSEGKHGALVGMVSLVARKIMQRSHT